MTGIENDELILDQFRKWLQETRQEAAENDDGANSIAPFSQRFSLGRLVEEFTALRHELKLQTRSSRGLEERVEASMATLADAAATLRSAAAREVAAGSELSDKNIATALADLDEALDRGREQWKKNIARLAGPSSPTTITQLNEIHTGQTWWQRRFTSAYHHRICRQIERAEEQARGERQALLTALLNGYDLIQQRLSRTMANAGVIRIPAIGQIVDPELMVVVEVIDAPGPPGQVYEEIRRGYIWKSGLLRPAEVRAIRPRFEVGALTSPTPLPAGEKTGMSGE
jgi:molecular chaperone GrpE